MRLVCSMIFAVLLCASSVQAQGLFWKLPDDEKGWCRYDGTYKQTVRRPQSAEGDLTLEWTRQLTIKSLESKTNVVSVQKKQQVGNSITTVQEEVEVHSRWVEIKQVTGHVNEGVIDAGPGGIRIYKLLIQTDSIRDSSTESLSDNRSMFVSYVPISMGYRKIGEEPAAAIEGRVFDLYPMVSLLRHFRNLESSGDEVAITTPYKELSSKLYKGDLISETPTLRTTTVAEIYRSDEAPFGVAKWTAKVNTETKQSTAPRTTFVAATEIIEEMSLSEVGTDAETELVIDGQ